MSYNRPGRGQPRRQSQRPHAGFTLVEILTVVAIIAILMSMAVLAYKYVGGTTRSNATNTTLQTVRGLLAEFEGSGGRMKDLLSAYNDTSGKAAPLAITGGAYNPETLRAYLPSAPTTATEQAITYGQPYFDLYNTAYKVMPRLRAIPANKAVLDKLPADLIYPKGWDPKGRSYQPGERVVSGSGFYICTTPVSGSTQPPDQDTGHWAVDAPNYLVLDPSGVPLLFVPPAGAVNLREGGFTHAVGGKDMSGPKQSPERKGYFMSAGEDRDFSAGDDNIYSFENK